MRPITDGVTNSAENGLDPAVRARLDRLVAESGPRRAHEEAGRVGRSSDPESPAVAFDDNLEEPERPTGGLARLIESLRLSKRHAWALALLVLVGVVASSGWTLRARAVEVGSPAPVASGSAATGPVVVSSPITPTPTPTPIAITVHVLGAVVTPGVVVVPGPARVRDVIAAAGGLRSDADPGELNLAALVSDGAQVVIGTKSQPRGEIRGAARPADPAAGAAPGPTEARLDLNTATVDQLDGLPGVGPVTAQAILAWRAKHGRFSKVEELQEVDGIGPKTYAQIAPHVRV